MKMKSVAVLALTGLLATAYLAPVMAEEADDSGLQALQLADNSTQNGGVPNVGGMDSTSSDSNNDGTNTTDNMNNSDNSNNNSNNNNNNTGSTSDEGSPDTTTGDDDY